MRKSVLGLLTLGILVAAFGTASAETRSISWSPVTTYTDGTPITGKTITYSIYWTTDAGLLTSLNTIASGVTQTSTTFDPGAQGMIQGGTVYFAMKTALSSGEVSALSAAYPWVVPVVTPSPSYVLTGISVNGPASVNEGATGAYTATATWSDGTTSGVNPAWSVSNAYATINAAGVLAAAAVAANQTVTVTASYSSAGVTKTAGRTVTILNAAPPSPTLGSISVSGPVSVNEGATGAYTATATWSDGTTSGVNPAWSVSNAYATINSAGVLAAAAVTANQTVTVTASYSSAGVTKTAGRAVTIANLVPYLPAPPGNLRISGQVSSAPETWRLAWDPVTKYADGQDLGAGRTVRYYAYWTPDPSLAAGTLVPLASSVSAVSTDFQPLAQAMAKNQRIYFTLRAILDSGEESALSGSLAWRVSNIGPAPPSRGKIVKK